MSKKGSSAPAPDPRLIDAQIKSMGIQDDMISRIVANSDRLLPLQEEQMRLGIDDSRADREWMLGRREALTGLQDSIIRDVESFNEGDRREELMSSANADITQAFDAARGMEARGLTRMGVNPNDGRFAAFRKASGWNEALARANAGQKVTLAARAEGMGLKANTANMLSGYPSMAAGLIGGGLNMTNAGLGGMNSGYGAAGGMAGQMGSNATNMWSAQAQYKTNQDRLASESNPINTVLGAATGVATRWMLSDRRAKTEIVPVGQMDNGLTLYRFRYKAGGPTQIGVMADEVAKVVPSAYRKGAINGFDAVDYAQL